MNKATKIARVGRECVACGCCVTNCPKGAIRIDSGVIALIDGEMCIGICPAAVITIADRRTAV